MSNLRRSSSSCLTVAAFIIIAVLAVRYYSDAKLQKNVGETSLYQKGANAVNGVWSYAKVLANINLIKNLGIGNANLGQNIKKEFESISTVNKVDNFIIDTKVVSSTIANGGAVNSYDVENNRPLIDLTRAGAQVDDNSGDLKNVDLKKGISSMFSYQKTSDGAEIIITSKSGAEHKLSLPFKFLAK